MICGLIIYAYAIGEAMLHPYDHLSPGGRMALATGISLYVLSIVLAYWRATGRWMVLRMFLTLLIAGLCIAISNVQAVWTLAIALGGLILLCAMEYHQNPSETSIQ
jgi:hypothetical protein